MPCNCEYCVKCEVCNHTADSHMCGEGPCMVKDCPCNSFNDEWHKRQLELQQFADIGDK